MISLRQMGISTALFCLQIKEAFSLVVAWFGFSCGNQVIPTNDALRERRGSLGIGWPRDDAGMHVGKCPHGGTTSLHSPFTQTQRINAGMQKEKRDSFVIHLARNWQHTLVYVNIGCEQSCSIAWCCQIQYSAYQRLKLISSRGHHECFLFLVVD